MTTSTASVPPGSQAIVTALTNHSAPEVEPSRLPSLCSTSHPFSGLSLDSASPISLLQLLALASSSVLPQPPFRQ
jgi:hypothetical protein